jgi:hypothetical protein
MPINSRFGRQTIVASLAIAGVLAIVAGIERSSAAATTTDVQWDARASQELTQALHKLHEVWNNGDVRSLKSQIIGDETLVTFELDPEKHLPLRLASKRDIDGFVDAVVSNQTAEQSIFKLDPPTVNCKATGTIGICTEECTVHVTTPDGVEQVDRLWSTAVAVKQGGEWKWVQWQMSNAQAPQFFRNGQPIARPR